MKRCSYCHETKDEEEFSRNSKNRDGYQSYCKECDKINQRMRRLLRGMKPRSHIRRKHKCTYRFGFCIECRNIAKRDAYRKYRRPIICKSGREVPQASFGRA